MTVSFKASQYQPQPMALQGRTVLVTGASSGIGRAVALAYAELGAQLIITSRTVSALEQLHDQICDQQLLAPSILPVDLKGLDQENSQMIADRIGDQYGQLNGLVHCAGILGPRTNLAQYDYQQWQEVMHVNVSSQFLLSQSLLPLMQAGDHSSLIFTSSSVGRVGRAHWGAYSVSKFATEAMVQIWAQELDQTSTLRVNCVNPGSVATGMRASAYPAEDASKLKRPEQVTATYLYLMCSDSNGLSGQSLDAQPI